jgi:hypothetical protein
MNDEPKLSDLLRKGKHGACYSELQLRELDAREKVARAKSAKPAKPLPVTPELLALAEKGWAARLAAPIDGNNVLVRKPLI